LFLEKKPFVGYEYAAFKFLKRDGYAQRLCNQIHNFGYLRKNYKNTTNFENKTNMNKTQNK
jgi:glutamate/tyrosine decarboxylase-like PLP-dependent enzyme